MKTLFVGSEYDIINCSRALLVELPNQTLDIKDLSAYTISHFGTNKLLLQRDERNELFVRIPSSRHFNFTHIIYYDAFSVPIGFTDLQQTISTQKYGIETITLSLDFTIFNSLVEVSVVFNYGDHISETIKKIAHLSLFNDNNSAVSPNDIVDLESKPTQFSKNFLEIDRIPNRLYKYSGNFGMGSNFIKVTDISISEGTFYLLDLIQVDNKLILISDMIDKLQLKSDEFILEFPYPLGFKIKFLETESNSKFIPLVGSNVIILTDGKVDLVYLISDLLKGEMKPIQVNNLGNKLRWYYIKNPFTKVIMFYCKYLSITRKVYEDLDCYRFRLELGLEDLTSNYEILLLGEGFALTREKVRDGDGNLVNKYYLHNYESPNLLDEQKQIPTPSKVIPLTPTAILYRLEFTDGLSSDENTLFLKEYLDQTTKVHNLGKRGSHKKLYKLMKIRRVNWYDLLLTDIAINGNLYMIQDKKLQIL